MQRKWNLITRRDKTISLEKEVIQIKEHEMKKWFAAQDEEVDQTPHSNPLLPRDYPLAAHVLLHVGEMLLAITLANFFLRTFPKFLQVCAALFGIWG